MQMRVGGKWVDVLTNVEIPSAPGGTPNFTLTADVTNKLGDSYKAGSTRVLGDEEGQLRVKPDKDATAKSGKPTSVKQYIIGKGTPNERIVEGARAPISGKPGEYGIFSYTEKDLEGKPFVIKTSGPDKNAELYIKPTAGAGSKAKGIDDPVALASFEGMIGNWTDFATINSGLNGGLEITEANKAKLLRNPSLKAGDDFPITRRDGVEISKADQKNLVLRFRNMHLSAGKNLKKGVDFLDINRKVLSKILSMSASDLGLTQIPGQRVEQKFATNPGRISTIYESTAQKLKTLTPEGNAIPAIETLINTPRPISTNNMRTGIGKLKIASVMSERPFRNTDFVKRADNSADPYLLGSGQMKGIDPDDVQDRVLLEVMSADPSINSIINPAVTPDMASQTASMAGEFKKVKQAQKAKWDSPDAEVARRQVGLLTNTLELIDDISALAHASKTPGFGQGAVEQAFLSCPE